MSVSCRWSYQRTISAIEELWPTPPSHDCVLQTNIKGRYTEISPAQWDSGDLEHDEIFRETIPRTRPAVKQEKIKYRREEKAPYVRPPPAERERSVSDTDKCSSGTLTPPIPHRPCTKCRERGDTCIKSGGTRKNQCIACYERHYKCSFVPPAASAAAIARLQARNKGKANALPKRNSQDSLESWEEE